jgi:hypothetical protein
MHLTYGPRAIPAAGAHPTWQVDPRYDLTVIIWTQRLFESPSRPAAHAAIMAAAYDALAGRS